MSSSFYQQIDDASGVNSADLRPGDLVMELGTLFCLRERHFAGPYGAPSVFWFDTEVVARIDDTIPESWLDNWIIQGNSQMKWRKVTDNAS